MTSTILTVTFKSKFLEFSSKLKKIEIDDLGYFTHRLLRYIDFEAYVHIDKILSRHEQKDEQVVYTQFLLDDGWCLLDEKNFILKEENENEKLKQTISVDRERWRLKLIKDVCKYVGMGISGWPDQAPFDRIIIAATLPKVPDKLISQLRVGGKMVFPLKKENREFMVRLHKTSELDYSVEWLYGVIFVPFVGEILK